MFQKWKLSFHISGYTNIYCHFYATISKLKTITNTASLLFQGRPFGSWIKGFTLSYHKISPFVQNSQHFHHSSVINENRCKFCTIYSNRSHSSLATVSSLVSSSESVQISSSPDQCSNSSLWCSSAIRDGKRLSHAEQLKQRKKQQNFNLRFSNKSYLKSLRSWETNHKMKMTKFLRSYICSSTQTKNNIKKGQYDEVVVGYSKRNIFTLITAIIIFYFR